MPHIQGLNRNQLMVCSLDSFVSPESIARIIDAFTSKLDLAELGFNKTKASNEGRPSYEPKILLSLYMYGSRKSIRSSRKLDEACKVNMEVKWLMNGLEPDFRTISDFRKDNIDCLKKVFKEFNRKLATVLVGGFKSLDGSKFYASNSKDNNFTQNKLDDRIAWLDSHSEEYLRQLSEMDGLDEEQELTGRFTRVELEQKLQKTQERLERYKRYRDYMEASGLSQISLTDPDSKLMKSKNGFCVSYNVQAVVDSETHLIDDFYTTNQVTDHGLIHSCTNRLKGVEILEVTTDKGYNNEEDMIKCLESGIIPHVALPDGKDVYELYAPYEANEIDEAIQNSTDSENLKKCLRAGIIPNVYENIIDNIEIIEKNQFVPCCESMNKPPYSSTEEMLNRAALGFFVRDPERNIVFCPAGAALRQKCMTKGGRIRYANKLACKNCKLKKECIKGKSAWKEIDFSKDTLEKQADPRLRKTTDTTQGLHRQSKKGCYEKIKLVKITFRPDRKKMGQRMCISEHPFGTIKRAMNAGFFLLRTLRKVSGEVALMCLGYNMQVAKNLLGFDKMMEAMAF